MRVLVLDSISAEGLSCLTSESAVKVDYGEPMTEAELIDKIPLYDALMVRSATKVTAAVLEAGKRLQIVGRAGVGVDNIDLVAATDHGVYVCNSPTGNICAAAEHAVGLLFACSRHIAAAHLQLVTEGKWNRKLIGSELKGRTLGVVGCGQVGSRVIRIMTAVGMDVIGFDPYMNDERAEALGIERVTSLKEIFRRSNAVTLHIPKTKETENIINDELLKSMPKGAMVINCARGGLIDENALAKCLECNSLGAAGLDVFAEEPLVRNSPLLKPGVVDKVVFTPHLGGSTMEAQLNVAVEVAKQIAQVYRGEVPSYALNRCNLMVNSLVQGYEEDEIAQLLDTSRYLGEIASKLVGLRSVRKIRIVVDGDFLISLSSPNVVLAYAAVGLLSSRGDKGRVNLVNIEKLCTDNCISLHAEVKRHKRRSDLYITIEVADGHSVTVGVTYSTRLPNEIILKEIAGVPCHMKLPRRCKEGVKLLYTLHKDIIGVLATVASNVASEGIDIRDCHLAHIDDDKDKEMENAKLALSAFVIVSGRENADIENLVKRGRKEFHIVQCIDLPR